MQKKDLAVKEKMPSNDFSLDEPDDSYQLDDCLDFDKSKLQSVTISGESANDPAESVETIYSNEEYCFQRGYN